MSEQTTSQLIKKELNLEKGSKEPDKMKVGNLGIEQIIKISKMKEDGMLVNEFKSVMKNVVGCCKSMGVLIEGKDPVDVIKEIDTGIYDKEIKDSKTEVSEEKKVKLNEELEVIQQELNKKFKVEKAEEKPGEEKKSEEKKK
jgi:large subunit ribosomal protein L11